MNSTTIPTLIGTNPLRNTRKRKKMQVAQVSELVERRLNIPAPAPNAIVPISTGVARPRKIKQTETPLQQPQQEQQQQQQSSQEIQQTNTIRPVVANVLRNQTRRKKLSVAPVAASAPPAPSPPVAAPPRNVAQEE